MTNILPNLKNAILAHQAAQKRLRAAREELAECTDSLNAVACDAANAGLINGIDDTCLTINGQLYQLTMDEDGFRCCAPITHVVLG